MAATPRRIEESARTNRPQAAAGFLRTTGSPWEAATPGSWWTQHREASLNWLALGMLLAAWNAADNDPQTEPRRRPDSLRGYSSVSVRAAARAIHWGSAGSGTSGSGPDKDSRNATSSETSLSVKDCANSVLPITRTASASVATEPLCM